MEEKDLHRLYAARLDAFNEKQDQILTTMLTFIGQMKPWLDEAPKARDKVQAIEVSLVTQKSQLDDIRDEMKEDKRQAFWKGLLASTAAAAVSFTASILVPHK